ncbi:TPA: hypothetical protein N0F65_001748 [Lagenidium giganteum]|uniref:Uncharacterized protein n=1 Tax=Lagenidium giganteum TaxID=4803 RepID=A0AAV2Z5Y1_9STRA|nr:TPA: hypothetical protein N0F65_001748 [Lagenidium giganteum]
MRKNALTNSTKPVKFSNAKANKPLSVLRLQRSWWRLHTLSY